MKLNSKAKISLLSIILCLAVAVSIIFCTTAPVIHVRAATGDNVGDYGIKFVQVASGDDFVIGLTYDGKVYGGALSNVDKNAGSDYQTLGQYYYHTLGECSVMMDITPEFVLSENYATNIAATKYTAALTANDGRIYTWGADTGNYRDFDGGSMETHYLLLRDANSGGGDIAPWYQPAMINYKTSIPNVGEVDTASINPAINSNSIVNVKIAGGDFNYIITFGQGNETRALVWGSSAYFTSTTEEGISDAPSSSGAAYFNQSNKQLTHNNSAQYHTAHVVHINTLVQNNNTTIPVAGGHTVGFIAGTDLYIRGRNFVIDAANNNIQKVYTLATNARNLNTSDNAIAGQGYSTLNDAKDETQTAFSKVEVLSNGTPVTSNRAGVSIKRSYSLSEDANIGGQNLNTPQNKMSIGNGMGYVAATSSSVSIIQGSQDEFFSSGSGLIDGVSGSVTSIATGQKGYNILVGESKESLALIHDQSAVYTYDDRGAAYLSLAVTSNGVYAGAHTPVSYTENKYKIVSVFSGYNATAFGISTHGKLYQISIDGTVLKFDLFESFKDSAKNELSQWSVSDSEPTFIFTVDGTKQYDNNNHLKKLTLSVSSVDGTSTATQNADSANLGGGITMNGGNITASGATGTPTNLSLLSSNYSGDAIRFADFTSSQSLDDEIAKLYDSAFISVNDLKPVFTIDTNNNQSLTLTEEQAKLYFNYRYVSVSATNTSQIVIEPIRSTNNHTITAKFAVVRYDMSFSYAVDYYTFKFSIANSPAKLKMTSSHDDAMQNESIIPLLDTNNTTINTYSIAFQNVSKGIDEFINFISGGSANSTEVSAYKNGIISAMASADTGFPAKSKIAAGNLNYYYGSTKAELYYDDDYKYMYDDIDGDVIYGISPTHGSADSIRTEVVQVTLTLNIQENDFLHTFISNKKGVNNAALALNTEFANVYGFSFNLDSTDRILISYRVLKFTALANTGTISYANSNGVSVINNANTSSSTTTTAHLNLSSLRTKEYYVKEFISFENISYNTNSNLDAQVSNGNTNVSYDIYADSFVHISNTFSNVSKNLSIIKPTNTTSDIYGAPDAAKNEMGIVPNNTVYMTTTTQVGSTLEIKLSDLFTNVTDAFTYTVSASGTNSGTSTAAYAAFSQLFADKSGYGRTIVSISSNGQTLTVAPTTANTLNIALGIQRFVGTRTGAAFRYSTTTADEDPAEKIYVYIQVKVVYSNPLTRSNNAPSEISIKGSGDVELVDTSALSSALNSTVFYTCDSTLYRNIKIISVGSSDPNVVTVGVNYEGDTEFSHSLRLNLVSSGTATVSFVIKLFDRTYADNFLVRSTGTTVLDTSLNVIDYNYVYISNILSEAAIKSNDTTIAAGQYVLYPRVGEATTTVDNASWYFEKLIITESGSSWQRVVNEDGTVGLPPFISGVSFIGANQTDLATSSLQLRIAANTSSTDTSGQFRLHLLFGDKSLSSYSEAIQSGRYIDTILNVTSSRVVLKPAESDLILKLDIDTDNLPSKNDGGDFYTANDRVYIPVKELFAKYSETVLDSPENYTIYTVVTAENEASQYFLYTYDSSSNVILNPLYNTENDEGYIINVSLYNPNDASSSSRIITFAVSISGITTTLTKQEYETIWMAAFFITLGVIVIYFFIALIIYWNKRGKQREQIRKNRELIKMRDRMHSKVGTEGISRQDLVQAKMKLEDPKYQKMAEKLKKERAKNAPPKATAVTEDQQTMANQDATMGQPQNNDFQTAQVVPTNDGKKGKKGKEKPAKAGKGGKKSVAELKAELEARRQAFNNGAADQPAQEEPPTYDAVFQDMTGGSQTDNSAEDVVIDAIPFVDNDNNN